MQCVADKPLQVNKRGSSTTDVQSFYFSAARGQFLMNIQTSLLEWDMQISTLTALVVASCQEGGLAASCLVEGAHASQVEGVP